MFIFVSTELGLAGANCEGIKPPTKIHQVSGFQVFMKQNMNYKTQQSIILRLQCAGQHQEEGAREAGGGHDPCVLTLSFRDYPREHLRYFEPSYSSMITSSRFIPSVNVG